MSINGGLPGGDLPEPARLSAYRLWAGGIATGIVAALAVVAGVYIARGILGISVLAPKAAGSLGSSPTLSTPLSPPRARCWQPACCPC
jgi:hypothetical protein